MFAALVWHFFLSCNESFFFVKPLVSCPKPGSVQVFNILVTKLRLFIAFQAGKMRVRKRLTCSCERSCRCVSPTPWGRWLCCRITCSASPLSNWCRNGESTHNLAPTRAAPPVKRNSGYDAFGKLQDNRRHSLEAIFFFKQLPCWFLFCFLKVHAELRWAAGLREQEARGPSHSEWVSQWVTIKSINRQIRI